MVKRLSDYFPEAANGNGIFKKISSFRWFEGKFSLAASRRPVDPIGSFAGRRLDTKRKRFVCSAPTTVEGRRSLILLPLSQTFSKYLN